MSLLAANLPALWPLAVYGGLVLLVVVSMLGVSAVVGERRQDRTSGEPYESGIVSTGSARLRMSVKFYLVAMFFVIFDLEAAFIFSWAVCVREAGWAGYVEMLTFVGVLAAALIYLWRIGALDWGASAPKAVARNRAATGIATSRRTDR